MSQSERIRVFPDVIHPYLLLTQLAICIARMPIPGGETIALLSPGSNRGCTLARACGAPNGRCRAAAYSSIALIRAALLTLESYRRAISS
jgi:hypothetical protein